MKVIIKCKFVWKFSLIYIKYENRDDDGNSRNEVLFYFIKVWGLVDWIWIYIFDIKIG